MSISPDTLRALISYDCETGALVWRERSPSDFVGGPARTPGSLCKSFNNKHAGKPALIAPMRKGHLGGHVKGAPLLAHRVAWAIHYGEWPSGQIDHINGNPSDNRIANLRDVPASLNTKNAKLRKENRTGVPGVYPSRSGKWLVYVSSKYVGTFGTFSEAVAARKEREVVGGFHENHGRIDAAMEALAGLKARCIAIRKARAA